MKLSQAAARKACKVQRSAFINCYCAPFAFELCVVQVKVAETCASSAISQDIGQAIVLISHLYTKLDTVSSRGETAPLFRGIYRLSEQLYFHAVQSAAMPHA